MNDTTKALRTKLSGLRVLPVLTVEDAQRGAPLARALAAGGLTALEITLRTPAALEVIRQIRREVPEVLVGAGTVTRRGDLEAAAAAGASFAVSPGLTPALIRAAEDSDIPLIPGVMTPSEALAAREEGFRFLKLFPAAAAGGTAFLKAVQGPFPDLHFCPTGGIHSGTFRGYLELSNVVCVGGSWVSPRAAVARGDWPLITRLAEEASS